jgi:dipeptidase E
MPIVEPTSFVALGCLPFQINAHYLDTDPGSTHAGETREARLLEFLEENDVAALGLREGTHLRVRTAGESSSGEIRGTAVASGAPGPAVLFQREEQPTEIEGDVTRLLHLSPVFDSAR